LGKHTRKKYKHLVTDYQYFEIDKRDFNYRTLIIDDEKPVRLIIKELLQSYLNCIEIIEEATNGIEAIELIELLKPDLIFVDIQMPVKDGFGVLQCLTKVPLVVFCTAFDEYTLQAFETNSIDYLVKPVKVDRLQKTIAKLQGIR